MSDRDPDPQFYNNFETAPVLEYTPPSLERRIALIAGAIVIFGGFVALGVHMVTPRRPEISFVQPGELSRLAASLTPADAPALLAGRACSPLARIVVWHSEGAADGTLRVRSGSYVSPSFQITRVQQEIALPLPTKFSAGHGTVTFEGTATGVNLALYPVARLTDLAGGAPLTVRWEGHRHCGG